VPNDNLSSMEPDEANGEDRLGCSDELISQEIPPGVDCRAFQFIQVRLRFRRSGTHHLQLLGPFQCHVKEDARWSSSR
jgi:hypothetical protein